MKVKFSGSSGSKSLRQLDQEETVGGVEGGPPPSRTPALPGLEILTPLRKTENADERVTSEEREREETLFVETHSRRNGKAKSDCAGI